MTEMKYLDLYRLEFSGKLFMTKIHTLCVTQVYEVMHCDLFICLSASAGTYCTLIL